METITMTGNDATDLTTTSGDVERQTISVVQLALPSQNQNSVDNNQSVIHTPSQLRTIQIANVDGELVKVTQVPSANTLLEVDPEDEEELDNRKRLLARRPSYRKIFNDLSSPTITVTKIEEESDSDKDNDITNLNINTSQVLAGTRISLPADTSSGSPNSGLQTLTMTNATTTSESGSSPTIVQYTQSADGQFYIPAGSVQAYQISTPTSLPQTVVMAAGSNVLPTSAHLSEEATRKRELRLLKNRDAAKECRRKKKEYVKCLENRVAVLENQNKTLIDELKALKELYCQKEG